MYIVILCIIYFILQIYINVNIYNGKYAKEVHSLRRCGVDKRSKESQRRMLERGKNFISLWFPCVDHTI